MSFLLILAIIVTILAIVYILSPVDFLPELVLGPFGLLDDAVAILIAAGFWFLYFAFPIIQILFYLLIILLFLIIGILVVIKLFEFATGKKQVKRRKNG